MSLSSTLTAQDGRSQPQTPIPGAGADAPGQEIPPSWAADPRWKLVQRIVNSPGFLKSNLLSRFLLYVCSRTLSGRMEEISECQIGVNVFGRRPGYSTDEDNIVRNYARQLRQRLHHFFEEEGKLEPLRLDIPRGQYIPVFIPVAAADQVKGGTSEQAAVSPEAAEASAKPLPNGEAASGRRLALIAYPILLFLAVAAAVQPYLLRAYRLHNDPARPLWTQLLDTHHQTLLVPSDDGIVMFQNLTQHSVTLAEYINRDYQAVQSPYHIDRQNMTDLEAQRYTSVADLEMVVKISHLDEASPDRVAVRYARELHMDDLKNANVVLLGSVYSNPWVELFEKNLNFKFQYQPHPNASIIVNEHPAPGELASYVNEAADSSHRTYGVIALVPNLNNTGWVLIVEGLTMAGTQAAGDMLFSAAPLQPVLEKARSADGQLNPFEVLIETSSFGSNAPQARIIASRIHARSAAQPAP